MLHELIARRSVMKSVSLPRARHPLHIMPASCGFEQRTGAGYEWDGLKRGTTPFTIFQYTTAGQGRLRFADRMHAVRPGEAMLLTVPQNHRYWLEAGESWEFFWLSMSGAEALRIHMLIQKVTGPVFRPKAATIDRLAALCVRLIDGEAELAPAASALAYEAAMVLFEDVFGAATDEASLPPAIARVIRHVGAHAASPLDVDRMAEIAGLSRAHFSRLFTAATGMPPAEYLMGERMRLAAKLIGSDPSLGVKQIAARVGFDDPNYFAKAFRRAFGLSPTEFRTSGMYFDQSAVKAFRD